MLQSYSSSASYQKALDIRFRELNVRTSGGLNSGMPMSKKRRGLKAYGDVKDQEVKEITSPEKLVKLLFDKACLLMKASITSIEHEDRESFQKSCLHALQIVLSLRFVLKMEDDNELSKSLFDTYTSIAASLMRAKESEDVSALGKIYQALNELREAWTIMLSNQS